MRRTFFVLLLASASMSLVFAQPQGRAGFGANHAQSYVKMLTQQLGLTPDQQSKAAAIFAGEASSTASVRASLRAAHQALQDDVRSNNLAGIDQQASAIGGMTAQLTSSHAKAEAALHLILTPEQQSKLDQMESQRSGAMRQGWRRGGADACRGEA